MSAAVLEALEGRFGASDADREQWLAERRGGLTATEIKELWMASPGQRVLAMRELVEKKLGRKTDSFSGNKYTAWGKEREPIIAELVRARYGIEPESRLVRAAQNPRHLASPDGIGVGFGGELMIAEIKTSGKNIAPGSPEFEATGYLVQMVWQMYVVGAEKCLFAYERRLGTGVDADPFYPGETGFEWFDRLDHVGLLQELLAIADEFLALLDAAADEPFAEAAIDEELDTLAVNVLRGRELEAQAKALKEPAWKELQHLLDKRGVPFSQESMLARITYTPGVPETFTVVDEDAAAEADPALWDEVLQAAQESERIAGVMARWAEHKKAFTRQEQGSEKGRSKLTVTAVKKPRPNHKPAG